jgi:hypothetical protein
MVSRRGQCGRLARNSQSFAPYHPEAPACHPGTFPKDLSWNIDFLFLGRFPKTIDKIRFMRFHCQHRSIATSLAAFCLFFINACSFAPGGLAAFKASQKAALRFDHFNVELRQTTPMGQFVTFQSLDCSALYFYEREVIDRTLKGIEQDLTGLSK